MDALALCGSLRKRSLNGAVLRAAGELWAPRGGMRIEPSLGWLPFFNQDVEESGVLPPEVAEFRERAGAAGGVLIATPEYASGTSGVLKNALEWLVGGGQLYDKPVALVSASPSALGGDRAQAWLRETLTMMGARLVADGLLIPQASAKIQDGRVVDSATVKELDELLARLYEAGCPRPPSMPEAGRADA
ncbi:NADPH-dependent FMN reductase [Streptomyces violens]|uniref:NADPH-dependent FMN reductase n=1 Tax=Streptomyces violens TaxID=66377 RepID=UPI0007C6D120|nr:NAD(P)H-dependent oxidoreductase [Streptomyces violens]